MLRNRYMRLTQNSEKKSTFILNLARKDKEGTTINIYTNY